MNKKTIATLLVIGCSVTGSAFASSFISKLVADHNSTKHSIAKTLALTAQSDRAYTDFSGTWLIDCGSSIPQSIGTIKNNAEYITLDDQTYKIGRGLQSKDETNELETIHEHTSFEWNRDSTALTMKGTDVSKENYDRSDIVTDMSTFTMSKVNKDQITLDGKFAYFEGLKQLNPVMDLHCVLTRKQ